MRKEELKPQMAAESFLHQRMRQIPKALEVVRRLEADLEEYQGPFFMRKSSKIGPTSRVLVDPSFIQAMKAGIFGMISELRSDGFVNEAVLMTAQARIILQQQTTIPEIFLTR